MTAAAPPAAVFAVAFDIDGLMVCWSAGVVDILVTKISLAPREPDDPYEKEVACRCPFPL